MAGLGVGQVVVEHGRRVDLEDLRAQVGHVDAAGLHRVRAVRSVLEHDVRVAGLELDLGDGLEERARGDLGLADARVFHHLLVLLGHGDVRERHAVDALDVVRGEQVHVVVALGQLEGDVRDDDAEREGLDADLLVRVLALGVQEAHDVRVVCVEVHRTGALARAELVGVGEGVFQKLHHGDDAGGLVLDVLDRRAGLADVGKQQRHAAAALGQLQRGVDGAADGLHVVLDAQQEAGHQLAALRLAGVQERRGGGLEAAGHDFVHKRECELLVSVGEEERRHGHAVFEALEVAAPVEGFQRVGGVVLVRAEEGLEAELVGVRALERVLNEGPVVLLNGVRLVVLVGDQIVDLFFQVVEVDGVLVDVLEEELVGGLAVLVKLDLAVFVVEVQKRVERVVIQLVACIDRLRDILTDSLGSHIASFIVFLSIYRRIFHAVLPSARIRPEHLAYRRPPVPHAAPTFQRSGPVGGARAQRPRPSP